MALKRVIPTLLLKDSTLVKTIKFNKFQYVGDPANTVKIFNELEVDELCFLDITATNENREPNYKVLKEIAEESFMPLSYGGGIKSFEQVKSILNMGFEKVVINTSSLAQPGLIAKISSYFGSQSIIGSIDIKSNWFGKKVVHTNSGKVHTDITALDLAKKLEQEGVGEILITSIDKDGTWKGYDLDLIKEINDVVSVPIIANGGCGSIEDIRNVFSIKGVQAAGVGSMVVFQKQGMGVLINYPQKEIDNIRDA